LDSVAGFLGMLHIGNYPGTFGTRVQHDRDHYGAQRILFCIYLQRRKNNGKQSFRSSGSKASLTVWKNRTFKAQVITKAEFVGSIMGLCITKTRDHCEQNYLTTDRVELIFEMPLGEIVFDFYDPLKKPFQKDMHPSIIHHWITAPPIGKNGYSFKCRACGCTVVIDSPR